MAELWTAICNNLGVIIGVVGSLVGTVLGWWLNNISKQGKLKITCSKWQESFQENPHGDFIETNKLDTATYFDFHATLDIYNDSADVKILRNIHVIFTNGNTTLFSCIPHDESTERIEPYGLVGNEVAPLNINPKSIMPLTLHSGLHKEKNNFDFLASAKEVWFVYNDENNKEKRIKITSNHQQEMQTFFEGVEEKDA